MGAFLETLLGNMYGWFDFFYCRNLSEHLWGWDMNTHGFTKELCYNTIGLYTLLISAIVMVTYYYFIDHPRFCKWWSWTIMAVFNSIMCLLLGYYCTYMDYDSGRISDDLMYVRDEQGHTESKVIPKDISLKIFYEDEYLIIVDTLKFAIGNHNARVIEATDNKRYLSFAKLIRECFIAS